MLKKSFTINLTVAHFREPRVVTPSTPTKTDATATTSVLTTMNTAWNEGQWDIAEKQWNLMLDLAAGLPSDEEEAAVLNAAFRWLHTSLEASILTHNMSGTRNPETLLNAVFVGLRLIKTFQVSDGSYWEGLLQASNNLACDNTVLDALCGLWVLTEENAVVTT